MPLTLRTLTLSFLVWESLFWVCKLAMRSARARAFFKPVVRRDSPAYIVSTVHAVFAAARGLRHIWRLWRAPAILKLCIPPDARIPPDSARFLAESQTVVLTNTALAGYLVSDLWHVVAAYPNLGKGDTIAHHSVFLYCALVAGRGDLFPFMFGWLIVGESSTPFLNLRWYLIRQGYGATQAMTFVSALFGAFFFLTRFCIYGAGLVHLYRTVDAMPVEKSGILTSSVLLCCYAGFVLNLFWLQKIFALAFGAGKDKHKVEKQVDESDVTSSRCDSASDVGGVGKALTTEVKGAEPEKLKPA